jgi:integrase
MEARIGVPESDGREDADTYRTWRLALQLLHDFHRFARRELAVEDPDWSEIDGAEDVLSIAPGMLLEKEYHHALKVLTPNPQRANREQLARALILLCAYRFGLRGAEATGLLRRDWVEPQEGMIVVLVRNNSYRTLKTLNGRRQVPLLFELSAHERQVIKRFFALWDSVSQHRDELPLLMAADGSKQLLEEKRLRSEVGTVIKAVTMNPLLSLHHARHTFANRAGALLFDGMEDIWPHAAAHGARLLAKGEITTRRTHARRLLLGTEQVTRRSTWALARLLGHAHPRTTLRSYVHFLPEWLATFVHLGAAARSVEDRPLQHVTDLDAWTAAPGYLQDISPQPEDEALPHPVNLEKLWRMLRRYQDGVPLARAAEGAEIEEADAESIARWIERIDRTLQRHEAVNRSLGGVTNLLSHIPAKRRDALRDSLTSRSLEIASGAWAPHLIEQMLDEMMGPSRQLLLWRRDHFLRFAQAMRQLGLDSSHFQFVCASAGHDKLNAWAAEAGLDLPQQRTPAQPQVDSVVSGDPPVRIKHRVAVTLNTDNGTWLQTSYEFVAVFALVMMLLSAGGELSGDGSMRTNV